METPRSTGMVGAGGDRRVASVVLLLAAVTLSACQPVATPNVASAPNSSPAVTGLARSGQSAAVTAPTLTRWRALPAAVALAIPHAASPPAPVRAAASRPRLPAAASRSTPPAARPVSRRSATPAPALPLPYSGLAGQLITVVAPAATSTTATVTAWSRSTGRWRPIIGPVPARIGADGVGAASESRSRTPAGTYRLTQAFGRQPDPGAHLPYFQTTPTDWWDENPASPTYNTHVRRSTSPGGNSENLYDTGAVYDYAVNINYNTARTPGAGSAIFLHVSNGPATAGCVSIARNTLVQILQWLTPADTPVIVIGAQ